MFYLFNIQYKSSRNESPMQEAKSELIEQFLTGPSWPKSHAGGDSAASA